MKERPIRLTGDEVRAIRDGHMTQIRRVIKIPPAYSFWGYDTTDADRACVAMFGDEPGNHTARVRCPYGATGDRLWVRETWGFRVGKCPDCVVYRADDPDRKIHKGLGWHPSIHMPHWASRITLEITSVRVERPQDISEADAWAIGFREVRP